MASILRQIVAGPRLRHPEANLDLCYVTDNIIATSGPSAAYPSLAYRNPLSELVAFLDAKHKDQWCLFEFRAEGCGYPDDQVYGRVWHWPWPDHHPPPFALVPKILGSMRGWLEGDSESSGKQSTVTNKRVAVVHCKAGKGRSGTMAISYMMTHGGWTKSEALQRFTERRMRPGFGSGVSIPSQLRWLDYVERWARDGGRMYVERAVEVTEVHIWGIRDGVKMALEGFIENGRKIKLLHIFSDSERDDFASQAAEQQEDETVSRKGGLALAVQGALRRQATRFTSRSRSRSPVVSESLANVSSETPTSVSGKETPFDDTLQVPNDTSAYSSTISLDKASSGERGCKLPMSQCSGTNVIFRPPSPIRVHTNDVNVAVERRGATGYRLSTVTSVAHVWFNCFFEGNGPENYRTSGIPKADADGVFTIEWEAMDGIKGSSTKGTRAFDKIAVVWREASTSSTEGAAAAGMIRPSSVVSEPRPGEKVTPLEAADWRGALADPEEEEMARNLGLENQDVENMGAESDEDGVDGVRRGVVDQPDQAVSREGKTERSGDGG